MPGYVQHVVDRWELYTGLVVALLPLLYLTRKVTWPIIAYGLTILIYTVIMHAAIHVILVLATWFRGATAFKVLEDGTTVQPAPLTSPLLEPWVIEQYNPTAVFYLEVVCFVGILVMIYYFQPMRLHKTNTYKGKEPQGLKPSKKKRQRQFGGSNLTNRPRYARKTR